MGSSSEASGQGISRMDSHGQALRYESGIDLANENNSHSQQIKITGSGKRVLEIGPATGFVTKALKDAGCKVTGVELDPIAAETAEEFCDRILVGNVEDIDLESEFEEKTFDVVLFGDVLEHLLDPAKILRRIRPLLSNEGYVVASIPNVAHGSVRLALLGGEFRYGDSGLLDRTHLRFFTKSSIEELFSECGYKIVEWRTTKLDVLGTELDLESTLPSGLLAIVRQDPEAMVYQYVVKAVPATGEQLEGQSVVRGGIEDASVVLHSIAQAEHHHARLVAAYDELASAHMTLSSNNAELAAEGTHLHTALAESASVIESQLGELQNRMREIAHSNAQLAQARAELAHADAALWSKASHLTQAQRAQEQLEQVLLAKQRRLAEVSAMLEQFENAAGYRLVEAYWARLDRLVPPDSGREKAYMALAKPVRKFLLSRHRDHPSTDFLREPIDEEGLYRTWFGRTEPTPSDLVGQGNRARALASQPLISVIVPVWNPAPKLLSRTIESVQAQSYPYWELCIADGNSSDAVANLLKSIAGGDSRINVVHLPKNLGISGNTNAALSLAKGEFVAFLDQTDLLAPFALFEVATRINKEPQVDCLYSDFDLVAADEAVRFNPFLAPDWSPELLLSSNYMAHLSVYRKKLVDKLGGVRSEFDGAQDWDLLLRVTETTDRIVHIPRVLYHWRADHGSAALTLESKPYALEAQRSSVQGHLDRIGWSAKVEVVDAAKGLLRIRWEPDQSRKVSIIIPTKSNGSLLGACLRAIAKSSYRNLEVLVVNTGRWELDESWLEGLGSELHLRLLTYAEPFNYSTVCNWAAQQANGDLLLFFNDDVEPLDPDWLTELVGWAERDEIGVVGARLTNEEGLIQHSGIVIGLNGFADHVFAGLVPGEWTLMGSTDWYRNFMAVTGACLMVSRSTFDEVGGWRDDFELCGGDVDLCLRIGATGRRVVCTPFAKIKHLEGATRAGNVPTRDYYSSFWAYHKFLMGGDPYFNRNLSLASTIPRLAEPADPPPLARVSEIIGRRLGRGPATDPRAEALAMAGYCNVSAEEVEATHRLHASHQGYLRPRSINWFVLDIDSPFYGGINTIFRMASYFKIHHAVNSRFLIIGSGPEAHFRSGMELAFPALAGSEIVLSSGLMKGEGDQPWADVSIASFWMTAYALTKLQTTKRKFYLVQDYEPIFYPAGTVSALAEDSYRMGHYGLCNTVSLRDIYERDYGGKGMYFVPSVDQSVFHPNGKRDQETYRVFLYARPGHDRNCYELAVTSLRLLKESLGDQVEIITAGSWGTMDGLHDDDFLHHLGLLDYKQTGELYRTCHAGLVLSVSKHPSYLPLEMMASGCLVVTNYNPATTWLLKHEQNCLLASPNAQSLHAALERGLRDHDLRSKLVGQALVDIDKDHSQWEPQMEKVFTYLCDPEAAPGEGPEVASGPR